MTALRRFDRALGSTLNVLCVASLCLLFATVTLVVVTRILALRSAGWTDELIELFFAWLLFPCAAALWRTQGHFTVDLIPQMLQHTRARRPLAIAVELLCLGFLGVFFWQACVFVESSASETSPVFGVSRVYWYGVMPLAAAIMIGYSVARVVGLLRKQELHPTV